MGTVHKFKRPPKNERQFQGYRPTPLETRGAKPKRWQLRGWQQTSLAWSALVLVAVAIWAIAKFFGSA